MASCSHLKPSSVLSNVQATLNPKWAMDSEGSLWIHLDLRVHQPQHWENLKFFQILPCFGIKGLAGYNFKQQNLWFNSQTVLPLLKKYLGTREHMHIPSNSDYFYYDKKLKKKKHKPITFNTQLVGKLGS